MNREQLQKVRDALEGVVVARHPASCIEAIAILDRELAAPEQEPVGWYCKACRQTGLTHCGDPTSCDGMQRTYLAPPSREWQSLTDEEIDQKIDECRMGMADYENSPTTYCRRFANELDALLRKKNSGEQA